MSDEPEAPGLDADAEAAYKEYAFHHHLPPDWVTLSDEDKAIWRHVVMAVDGSRYKRAVRGTGKLKMPPGRS